MTKKQRIKQNLVKYIKLNKYLQQDNLDSRVYRALCYIEKKLNLL